MENLEKSYGSIDIQSIILESCKICFCEKTFENNFLLKDARETDCFAKKKFEYIIAVHETDTKNFEIFYSFFICAYAKSNIEINNCFSFLKQCKNSLRDDEIFSKLFSFCHRHILLKEFDSCNLKLLFEKFEDLLYILNMSEFERYPVILSTQGRFDRFDGNNLRLVSCSRITNYMINEKLLKFDNQKVTFEELNLNLNQFMKLTDFIMEKIKKEDITLVDMTAIFLITSVDQKKTVKYFLEIITKFHCSLVFPQITLKSDNFVSLISNFTNLDMQMIKNIIIFYSNFSMCI